METLIIIKSSWCVVDSYVINCKVKIKKKFKKVVEKFGD